MNTFKIISYFKKLDENNTQRLSQYSGKYDSFSFLNLVQIFKDLTQKYCNLYNYKFKFKYINDKDLQPIIDNKNKFNFFSTSTTKSQQFKNIILYKILMTYEELLKNDSEYIVFIDTDALISNPNITLDSLIDNKHQIWLSHANQRYECIKDINALTKSMNIFLNDKECLELFMTDIKKSYLKFKEKTNIDLNTVLKHIAAKICSHNEGFFIVKNTENMKNLFYLMCNNFYLTHNTFTLDKDGAGPDGYLLMYFLNSSKYFDFFAYMNPYTQGHIMGVYEGKYNEDKSFIQHNFTVMEVKDKLKFAQKLKLNKWWNNFYKKDNINSILIESENINISNILDQIKNDQIKIYFDLPFYIRYTKNNYNNIFNELKNNYPFINIWNGEEIDKIINGDNT